MIEKPSPRVLWSWVSMIAIVALPLTAAVGWLLSLFWSDRLMIAAGLWGGCLLLFLGVYLHRRRRSLCFALEADRVWTRGGVFCITTRIMSIDAVRQVTLLQGPLERLCHTAFLLVSATGGYLLIEGIDQERAEEWRRRLISV